jgi:hypothetical protein
LRLQAEGLDKRDKKNFMDTMALYKSATSSEDQIDDKVNDSDQWILFGCRSVGVSLKRELRTTFFCEICFSGKGGGYQEE